MPPRKRHVETIDLTGDDDDDFPRSSQPSSTPYSSQGYAVSHASSSQPGRPRPSKQARTGYNNRTPSSSSQPQSSSQSRPGAPQSQPYVFEDDEEDDGSQEVPDSTQAPSNREYDYVFYGPMHAKIVGIRYYSGYATMGEMVIVRREPENAYDSNAIRVLNVQGEQIGHIPRTIAAKLAPYMDDRSLRVEGILTGEKGFYDCPVDLFLYGTNEPVERMNLVQRMKDSKLPVKSVVDRQRREEKERKEREKLAAKAAKEAKKNGEAVVDAFQAWGENPLGEFAGGGSQGMGPGPSMEDIMGGSQRFNPRNVEEIVEQYGIKEKDLEAIPKAEQPAALLTELHPFQLQGLQWMLDKESPELPAAGSGKVVQLWQRHARQANVFTNVATNFSLANPPLASGGILADDMGLGKTIQVISLIMADRALGRRHSDTADSTLILAPVSVMSNWSTQMAKHIKEEYALRIMFYHGTRKQKIDPKEIKNYDVVISTYDSVSSEYHSVKNTAVPRKTGVFSVKWRRIILDEGHNIRNPKSKRAVAVTQIMAQSKWALTGTPIINTLKDLFSLVKFIGLSGGLSQLEIFHGAIIRPVAQGDTRANKTLQQLMGDICLRRKKEMAFIDLRLPELSEYVHHIKLLPHEQEKYDALEAQAKGTLDVYRKNLNGRKDAANMYRHLLEALLRMRQLCDHWKLVGEERLASVMSQLEEEGIVDLTDENKVALQKMLQLSIDSQEDCPICLDSLREPVITRCAHVFCTPCLERVIETQHKCPMCRAELESLPSTTVKPAKETIAPPQPSQADLTSLSTSTSSKTEALLSILRATAQQDPTNKTIIFSQWTSFLDILAPHITAAGFKTTRIDGSMSATQRDAALAALDSDPDTTVMLASLAVCSVGLNLVAANHVIMSDSWWAPAIEDQAVDRVHRLGQKRETKVFRLVVEGSIEQRVLGIQEDKRKLMGLAFAEKEGERKRKGNRRAGAGLADLQRLLGEASQASQAS
ncbi:hypothetical protein BU24DRAFT_422060 [Aaosphaeria arxii CBS 175.79]|uniref:SNF2 family helicase n=1 Tax=Aaosphaeria arxii CBS 175.79 TaxID=1450172 RepID=A0A6A5XR39_9PLEO|nr:uncharacterized protein BU24DRAFT_422060 [Aaosphaeria arxii CBS 175.79]KAF2015748.1 hypothetical protein BU24DRAFT_422060 [Aaosphaeria arxii CBS 175.79]